MQSSIDFFKSKDGNELLGKLFQSSGEGIMVFDGGGRVKAMNPRAEEMFGYTETELLGELVEKLIPMNLRAQHVGHREKYTKKPALRSMGAGMDLEGLQKSGDTFPIEISLSYLKHEDQTLVVAFITDISLRKGQEKILEDQRLKLEEYTSKLESKVKSRTQELEHLNLGLQSQIQERKLAESELKKSLQELKKAEKKILKTLEKERELSELKSRFVSMASHEFRTPLTTISSSASLISKYPETDQQDNRIKHIDRIQNSVKNLTAILNDFLSIEKLDSGAVQVKLKEIDLCKLIEEIRQEMNLTLKKGQQIKGRLGKEIIVSTDPHLVKNLLFNLLSNASKYSKEGDDILLDCELQKSCVKLSVQDFGIGIPEKEQHLLFDRFFRAGNVTNIQGTGLGLNIAKKYVDLLQGTISFTSEEGKGSTFKIELPTNLS